MKSLQVLDVTLRDGGCVNDFNFGSESMNKILQAQENSGIDFIELGYIDEKNGSEKERTQYINEKVISQNFLYKKKIGTKYVVMMDYGKFDVDSLGKREVNGIDGIRIAFHKKDCLDMIKSGRKIIDKGYDLFIQPMITLRYSDSELLELIDLINKKLADASGFYIVDSFGEMRPNDMNRMLNLVDHNLIDSMILGFHSHNNLQMSYSNAVALLQFTTNRNMMLDSSIMGMGKGAGNLNTELLLEHLNLYYGKKYRIEPLLEVMDTVLNQIHSEFYWGYSPEYYLSSSYHCTPSYASYFYNKHMLPIDQVGELLGMIDENKKISFDEEYAEEIYEKFNERIEMDDSSNVDMLLSAFGKKKILLLAPGKRVKQFKNKIINMVESKEYIVIGLNFSMGLDLDYVMTTRREVYISLVKKQKRVIVPSNIAKGSRGNVIIVDYRKWCEKKNKIWDTSAVFILNILRKAKPLEVHIAGMDGFSDSINENYYNPAYRFPLSSREADLRNSFYSKFINDLREEGMKIIFDTPSKYDEPDREI